VDAEIPSWFADGGEGPGSGEEGPGDVRRFLEGGEDMTSEVFRGEGKRERERKANGRVSRVSRSQKF